MTYSSLEQNLERLPHFKKVIELGSISAAAAALHISQSALSRSIQALENRLDKNLLIRGSQGIAPTREGLELYKLSQAISELVLAHENTGNSANGIPDCQGKTFRLGTYDSIASYYFPDLIRALAKFFRGLRIDLEIARTGRLVDLLKNDEIDALIGVNLATCFQLPSRQLFSDHYSFYRAVDLEEMTDETLIIVSNAKSSEGHLVEDLLRPYKPRRIVRCENFETARALTTAKMGIGVLPDNVGSSIRRDLFRTEFRSGQPMSFGRHTIDLAHRRGAPWMKPVCDFVFQHALRWARR